MALTDIAIRNAKSKEKSYKLTDGDGMFLLISSNGSKLWRLKYRFEGKEKLLALGSYPEVSLIKAREKRAAIRKLLSEGLDPSLVRKEAKRERRLNAINTFEAIAREWHRKKSSSWSEKYAKTIMNRLEADLFNRIGRLPIKAISPAIMLDTLQDIEKRGYTKQPVEQSNIVGKFFGIAYLKA